MLSEGVLNTLPVCRDEQGTVSTREFKEPISSRNSLAFFHHSFFVSPTGILNSQFVGNLNFELETSDIEDAMYYSDVKEVTCCEMQLGSAGILVE